MIVYLAAPLDAVEVERGEELGRLRREARNDIDRHGMAYFDPSLPCGGFNNDPQGVHDINQAALHRCDGVLAIWPAGVVSVGVPMEIQTAHGDGKPVVVVGQHGSLQLKGMGVPTVGSVRQAVGLLFRLIGEREIRQPILRGNLGSPSRAILWTGDPGCAPTQGYDGDAGFDLYVAEDTRVHVGGFVDVNHGIQVELPPGVWALITGRSSTIRNRGILVVNGVIDNGYRGPLFAACQNLGDEVIELKRGERIAQLIPFPLVSDRLHLGAVAALSESARGVRAFGSTGD